MQVLQRRKRQYQDRPICVCSAEKNSTGIGLHACSAEKKKIAPGQALYICKFCREDRTRRGLQASSAEKKKIVSGHMQILQRRRKR